MISGVVKKVKAVEGFGFIQGADGIERFFHRSNLQNAQLEDLQVNITQVTFEHEDGKKGKGPRAANVRVV